MTAMTDHAEILDDYLELSPSVSLRPEPFGALAYHFGNRRLTFLKRPEMVSVVRSLDGRRTGREALREAGIPEEQWIAYARVLKMLVDGDMIQRPLRLVVGA